MRRSVVLSMAVAAAMAQFARADSPLAHDGVSLTSGNIDSVTTGTNFGAWSAQNPGANYYDFGAGLYYPYLQTAGGSAIGGGAYTSAGVAINTGASAFAPYVSGGALGADNTTLWTSFVVNNFAGSDGFEVSLHNSGVSWLDGAGIKVQANGGYWKLTDGTTTVSTGVKVDPAYSTLMVLKTDFKTGADNVTLYVNPTPGQAVPSSGTALTTASSLSLRSVHFYPGSGSLQGAVDEIRIGSTYSSVTPYNANATPAAAPKRLRSYMIGNSLTDNINTEALRQTVLSRGEYVPWGRNVILGSPLDNIVANPGQGFLTSPYNGWNNALPNFTWDVVSLEPFDRDQTSDKASIKTLIDTTLQNPQNSQTHFLLYERWPRKNSDGTLDYQKAFDGVVTPAGGTPETRAYFEGLVTEVRKMYPTLSKPINLVPVGDVMYEIENRIKAGKFTGLSDVTDLYADGIHLNNAGQFMVGMTYYATMFGESPIGLPDTYGVNNPTLAAQLQQVAWDVVSTNAYSGVSVPEPTVLMVIPAGALALLGRRKPSKIAAKR